MAILVSLLYPYLSPFRIPRALIAALHVWILWEVRVLTLLFTQLLQCQPGRALLPLLVVALP